MNTVQIGGFTPLSLSDFPGRVAAVVFMRGCNFRCPFCHNGHLLQSLPDFSEPMWDLPAVLARLKKRRRHLDAVVISGGEPTLQPALAEEVLPAIGRLGLEIQLDTNGSQPDVLSHWIETGWVQRIAMDVKAPWRRYAELAGVPIEVAQIQESVRRVSRSGIAHLFRTTWVKPLLNAEDLAEIRAQIPPGSPHRVQEFIPSLSFSPALRPNTRTVGGEPPVHRSDRGSPPERSCARNGKIPSRQASMTSRA